MKVAVWDTYVTKKDGTLMHFDIIVPKDVVDPAIILDYGKKYLSIKGQSEQPLSAEECKFCHIESVRPEWEAEINTKGYFIYEMEGCNN